MLQETLSLKTTKKGARVWLNNKTVSNMAFVHKARYSVTYKVNRVEITLNINGEREVSTGGIIDLQNKSMSNSFPDTNRVHVNYSMGRLIIEPYYHDEKVKRRETSFIEKIRRNKPLNFGELPSGFGYLGKQFVKGLLASGIATTLTFASDYDRHAIDILSNYNTDHVNVSSKKTIIVHDDLFTMNKNIIPEMDCLIIGYPCVGFSSQQSKVRNLDLNHDVAGMLFVPLLEAINRANPALILIENSENMQNTDTDFIIESVLKATGYKHTQTVLSGTEFGDFEQRKRLAKIYYSKNLPELDVSTLKGHVKNHRTLSDILEPIDDDDKAWRNLDYLKKKNSETSHKHKFIVPELTATRLPVFSATYGKTQADSTIIEHPKNPKLHRICSPSEHCNIRKIKGNLKKGICAIADGSHHLQKGRTNKLKAHNLLGNSISPTPWLELGKFVGNWAMFNFTNNFQQDLFA